MWESDSTADDVAENVKRVTAIHTAIGIFVTVTSLNMVSVTYQNPTPPVRNRVLDSVHDVSLADKFGFI
jgi:hypothetical protein